MVVLAECYLQRLEEKSIALLFALNTSPKTFKRCVDDSHAQFDNTVYSKPYKHVYF